MFTPIERHDFLQVPESLETLLTTRRSPVNQIGFVVMLGYFRASKRFFARQFHQADIDYVAGQLGYLPGFITLETYDKSVQSRHRRLILDYLGFRAFDDHAQYEIIQDIRTMVRSRMRPKTILLRTLEILESRKIEIPSAYTLTELIVAEAKQHQRDLSDVITLHLSAADKELLDALLAKPEETSAAQGRVNHEQPRPLRRPNA